LIVLPFVSVVTPQHTPHFFSLAHAAFHEYWATTAGGQGAHFSPLAPQQSSLVAHVISPSTIFVHSPAHSSGHSSL
jgi:hypothetical protein